MKRIILFILLSINIFSNYYIEDNKVYYDGKLIKNAGFKTLEVLNEYYVKDKNHVYYFDEKLENANVRTFKSI